MHPLKIIEPNIRVLLIDSHTMVRSAIRMLIDSHTGLQVVAEVGSPTESLEAARDEQPEVILFTVNEDGTLDLIPELLRVAKHARLLVVTSSPDPKVHQNAIRLGAAGIILKDASAESLFKAIDKVHKGETWLNRSMVTNVLSSFVQVDHEIDVEAARIATLTKREREIISLIGQGLRNKQVASKLFISEATVRHHCTSIFDKLNISDRLELVIYSYRYGLTELPSLHAC